MPVAYPTGNSRAGGWEDSLAGQIAKSSVYKKYFYSRDDVLQEAKTISRATRIPQNAILSSADNLDKARKVYERQQKLGIDDIDKLFREYPELDKLARMDDNAAAIALHNMENVKETRGVIESMKLGWELDELSNERGRLGYMGMNGGAYSEEQAKRIESIEKQLAEAKHLPGLFDDPLGAIAGGTVQAAKLMARGLIGGQKMGVYGAGFGALLGAVGGGSATLGTGTVPAAIAGAKVGYSIGTRIGMAQDMYEMVAGNNYLDFKQYKNKQGGQLLTDDQARAYAAVSAAVETGIEYSNADRILGIVKGSGAEQTIKDIIEQAKNNSEFRTMLAGYVTRGLKNIGSLTAEESAEEGVQEVGNRLISNVMAANNPDGNIPSYTSAEIIGGAIEATWQAVPGSLGIGLGVQSAGGISGARRIAAALRLQGEQQAGESKLAAGIGMLRRLGENIEKNILFKKNKEVYGQVLEQQLDGTGFDKVYVDTEMVLKQDGGYELLKNVADAAGIEEEKLQETIDNGGELEVATATYAQTVLPTELGQKLENYISFDEAADCFARNRYYAGRVKKEMDAILDFESRRQKEAIENFVDTSKTITRPEERQAAKMVISNYPDNPTDGVKHLKEKMQATMDSMIEPIVEQMRSGMGKGVSIIQYDAGDASGRGMRVSENDIWYQNYFKEHGRVPSNRELREIAYDVFTGNNEYGVAGWDNSEGMDRVYEDNKAELQGIRDAMAILDRIEPELAKIEPGQLTVTEGLSKEGYQVYLDTLGKLQQAQNKEVRLAARAGAVLLARAADRFAEYMRESGSKNYTALDYAKKYSLFVDEKAGVGGGYKQAAMKRSNADNLGEFYKEILESNVNPEGKEKKFYLFTTKNETRVDVANDNVLHFARKHKLSPEDLRLLEDSIEEIENAYLDNKKRGSNGGQSVLCKIRTPKGSAGVAFEFLPTGRIFITTMFFDSEENVDNWIKKEGARTSKLIDINSSAFAGQPSINSIRKSLGIVNNYNQLMGETGARNLDAAEESTIRLDNLAIAREMENAGKDASTIKLATGWERGADKKWRYETDDSSVTFSLYGDIKYAAENPAYVRYQELTQKFTEGTLTDEENDEWMQLMETEGDKTGELQEKLNNGEAALEDVLHDPELFKAYPELKSMPVIIEQMDIGDSGYYYDGAIYISTDVDKHTFKQVLIHEVQHAIQEKEGFAIGGGAESFNSMPELRASAAYYNGQLRYVNEALQQADDMGYGENTDVNGMTVKGWRELKAEYEGKLKDTNDEIANYIDPVEKYNRLAGETEARNVSSRMKMTMAERLASLASETEDVAREDQIVLMDGIARSFNSKEVNKENFYTIQLTGQEFGTYSDVKELRQKALRWYADNLQGTDAYNPFLGKIRLGKGANENNVRFTGKGKKELSHTSAKPSKLLAIRNLKTILEKSNLITDAASNKDKHNGEHFYYLHAKINVDGEDKYIVVNVKENQQGDLIYYNHNVFEPEEYKKIEDAYTEALGPGVSSPGQNPQEAPSFTNSITGKAKVYKQQSVVYNQTAYHGSPHKFDRFDLGAIGTGEGAQAHGWGLYFAADKKIAEGYKEKLSKEKRKATKLNIKGQIYSYDEDIQEIVKRSDSTAIPEVVSGAESKMVDALMTVKGDLGKAVEFATQKADDEILDRLGQKDAPRNTDWEDALSELKKLKEENLQYDNGSNLYEVDVPENDVLLDEDLPLNKQPDVVRKAIYEYYKSRPDNYIYDAGDASGRGMRVSENDIWYQNYFKEHGRVPSNRELREIAYDVFTGNNEYGVAGWDNSEGMDRVYEDNKAELQGIRDAMAILDRIEPELAKIEPGQLTVTEGLSKEGYQVYLDTLGKLQQAQNKEVRLAARAGAVLLARAADRFAEYMRESGSKNYTALDYAKKYSLFVDEKAGVGGGYKQAAMKRSNADNLGEFYKEILESNVNPEGKEKKFYLFTTKNETRVDVANDNVLHFARKHKLSPEDLRLLEDSIEEIENAYLDNKKRGSNGGQSVLCKIRTPKGSAGVAFEFLPTGRIFITTMFFDSEENVDNWIKKEGARTSKLIDINSSAFAGQPSINSIRKSLGIVNNYNQLMGETGARNLDAAEESTIRLDNLAIAREMENAGKDASTIKLATGWERGADKKWRYETDDSSVTFSLYGDIKYAAENPAYVRYQELTQKFTEGTLTDEENDEWMQLMETEGDKTGELQEKLNNGEAALEDVLHDPELFKAYPELKSMPVIIEQMDIGDSGYYYDGAIYISTDVDKHTFKQVLIHEVQHAIQEKEGFAIGGGAESFNSMPELRASAAYYNGQLRYVNEALQQADDMGYGENTDVNGMTVKGWRELKAEYEGKLKDTNDEIANYIDPVEKYNRLAGETEARNVSSRMKMTMAERLASLASETEDVAREDQIVLMDGIARSFNSKEVNKENFYTIQLTGQEFGTYSDVKELRQKALRWYADNLQGTDAYNPFLGKIRLGKGANENNVRFTGKGKKELSHTSAKPSKLLAIRNLKTILEKSNLITDAASNKDKHNGEHFYYLHAKINVDGEDKYIVVNVKENQQGDLIYYNHNVFEPEEYKKIEDAYTEALGPGVSSPGQNPQEAPSFTNSITGKAKVYKQQSVVYNQTAYHGSPHKFDRFDLGAIGTGEGAQAHGWGLYFAADKKIAEGYKEKLSKEKRKATKLNIKGQIYSYDEDIQEIVKRSDSTAIPEVVSGAESKMVDALMTVKGDLGKAVEFATQKADDEILDRLGQKDAPRNTDWEDALSELKKLKEENLQYDNGSNLYEVDVPENDVLLDEDLPLNKQPDVVRKAIYEYYKSRPDNYIVPKDENDLGDQTGEKFYKDVVFTMRVEGAENPQKLLPNC